MKNNGILFFKQKIIFVFLFLLCTAFSFGQQRFVWSTVSGSNVRVIPLSSVRSEVMRLYNRYEWMRFERGLDEGIFMDRDERINVIEDLYYWSLDNPNADRIQQQHRRQIMTWYDTHRSFVYLRDIGNMYVVSFVARDTVMEVTFGQTQFRGWFPTQNARNRQYFEEYIDLLLDYM